MRREFTAGGQKRKSWQDNEPRFPSFAENRIIGDDAMYGPQPPRSWPHADPTPFQGLIAGMRYEVVRAFKDFDGDAHAATESWVYLGRNFVPYEDGLSLFVSLDGVNEWQIRLQWRPEEQGAVIDNLPQYVRPVS